MLFSERIKKKNLHILEVYNLVREIRFTGGKSIYKAVYALNICEKSKAIPIIGI